MRRYEIWTPWDEVVTHHQLLYLNETDGRLDFYFENDERHVLKVWSVNYKPSVNIVMVDVDGNDLTPEGANDTRIYDLTEANVLKMRRQDAVTLRNEIGTYEDNFLTEGEDD
jgi:hypothetical protein